MDWTTICRYSKKKKINHIISKTRVNNYDDIYNDLLDYDPTHVISFIGRIHGTYNGKYFSTIDYLQQPGKLKENINDNLYGPIMIAEACKNYSKKIDLFIIVILEQVVYLNMIMNINLKKKKMVLKKVINLIFLVLIIQ